MRHDLRVRFGDEPVALPLELLLENELVLDDAVVDDDNAAGAVAVRMRVLLGWAAVGRPSGVADAVLAVDRRGGDHFLEARQLAGAPAKIDFAVAHDRHAGGIV